MLDGVALRSDEILSTLVELSVAVAGFSGVVAALAPSRPSAWPYVARTLFSVLLSSTAASATLALLAMTLLASPLSASASWAAVSATHAVFLAAIHVLRFRAGRRAGARVPAFLIPTSLVMLGIASTQFANAWVFRTAWLCIAGLALYAAMGFVYFILLVHSLWDGVPALRRADETQSD